MEGSGSNPDVATKITKRHPIYGCRFVILQSVLFFLLCEKRTGMSERWSVYGSNGLIFGTPSCPPVSAIFGMLSGTAESAIFSTSSMDETGIS
jgi:hypothetical protein